VEIVGVDVELRGDDRDTTTIDGGAYYTAVRVENAVVAVSGLALTGSPVNVTAVAGLHAVNGATVTVTDAAIRGVVATVAVRPATSENSEVWFENVVFEDNITLGGPVYSAVGGSVTMTHCVFRRNEGPILSLGDLDVTFTNNLVYDNETDAPGSPVMAFHEGTGGFVQLVMNNTVAENDFVGAAVSVTGIGAGLFWSNIVADNGSLGVSVPTLDPEYVDVWGHDQNYDSFTTPGIGSIESPPIFNDAASRDFSLDPVLSPCVDAGAPDAQWNDPDGTRNDMGAFGGPGGDWLPPS
jgi:hypothetical protein